MKTKAITALAVFSVVGLGFLCLKVKGFNDKEHERFQSALWQLKHLDTAFNEVVLKARFVLGDNYDDSDSDAEQTRLTLEELKITPAFIDPIGKTAIETARRRYESLVAQRAEIFERFKSKNAMLANSRRYLPAALDELATRLRDTSTDRELKSVADDLSRMALSCLATPDEAPAQMATRLEHIKDWCARHSDDPEAKFLSSLERHARIIATDNSEIDALMRQILALPSESSIQQLFQAYELNVAKAIQRAQQYRAPLYVLSFLVVIGMVGAFWALRSANRNLEQRVHERTRDLGRSEERFRTLCVASPIGIYMADPEGELVYANPAWEKVFQLTLNESLANRWQRALHPEERDLVIAEWRSATKGGATFTREFRLLVRAKETRWVVCQAAAIPGAKGEIAGFVGTAEDITERKRVEAALEQANKQFVEVSRKAGMSEVATSVLHNVGNVLNSVNISVSTISDRLKRSKSGQLANVTAMMDQHATDLGDFITKDTKGRGLPNFLKELSGQLAEERAAILSEVTSLTKNVDHLKGIVAMQQNYAKISGVTEKVNVTDLAEDALRLNASALLRHDVHLFREYDEHLPEITVEKHKALQILVNLIRNANQACDETRSMDRHLTVCVTNGSNRVRIAIKDNGVGIRAEHLNRIFSHGFTTKKDGHGFGLHSSCLAAKEMGGALTAHSDGQDKGATFVLELPWQPEKA